MIKNNNDEAQRMLRNIIGDELLNSVVNMSVILKFSTLETQMLALQRQYFFNFMPEDYIKLYTLISNDNDLKVFIEKLIYCLLKTNVAI